MAYEFKLVRRVEFFDTDMAGIVHFSNFFRYMEAAEHGFFRSLGMSIVADVEPPLGWPRVQARCDFEDRVEIHLLVREKRSKSLSYAFRLVKTNSAPPIEVARGSITVVCVRHKDGKMQAATIPQAIAERIDVAPASLLEALND